MGESGPVSNQGPGNAKQTLYHEAVSPDLAFSAYDAQADLELVIFLPLTSECKTQPFKVFIYSTKAEKIVKWLFTFFLQQ